MNNQIQIIDSFLDKLLFTVISASLILLFLLWVLSNIVLTNNLFIWFLMIPLSLVFSMIFTREYDFQISKISSKNIFVFIFFLFLLFLAVLYYLEPTLRFPHSSIGIPFKDMHDGIATFIADYGYPPTSGSIPKQANFITNTFFTSGGRYYQNLFLGYPNVMHSFSALLIKMGAFEFHATWFSCIFVIIINSLAVFLILKQFYGFSYFSAILAGLFGISSFRISYSIISSIVMLFSYSLIIPSLLIFLVSIYHYKNFGSLILPVLSGMLLAATFSGAFIIYLGFIFLYFLLLILYKERAKIAVVIKQFLLILILIPVFILILQARGTSYSATVFPPSSYFDPNELSQAIMPLDNPIYMIIYFVSLIVFIYQLFSKKLFSKQFLVKNYLFLINVLLLTPIIFDLVFYQVTNIHSVLELRMINPEGLFGGLSHFLMHRLALLQPFFFCFFVGELFYLIKNKLVATLFLTIFLLSFMVVRINLPLYDVIQPELRPSFYNQSSINKSYTLLSDYRLITNDQIWTPGVFESLEYLKNKSLDKKTLVLDTRNWTEESVVNWGSIYLREKLYSSKETKINPQKIEDKDISNIADNFKYLVAIDPSDVLIKKISSIKNFQEVFGNQNTKIYAWNSFVSN